MKFSVVESVSTIYLTSQEKRKRAYKECRSKAHEVPSGKWLMIEFEDGDPIEPRQLQGHLSAKGYEVRFSGNVVWIAGASFDET